MEKPVFNTVQLLGVFQIYFFRVHNIDSILIFEA